MPVRPFHLALPTNDVQKTIDFYVDHFDVRIGRSDTTWVDFDFFSHQLVFHHCGGALLPEFYNPVDSHQVPIPHMGVILTIPEFKTLQQRLQKLKVQFVIDPYVRFEGTEGEQHTLFFKDNNGYSLEFKAFSSDEMIFTPFEV